MSTATNNLQNRVAFIARPMTIRPLVAKSLTYRVYLLENPRNRWRLGAQDQDKYAGYVASFDVTTNTAEDIAQAIRDYLQDAVLLDGPVETKKIPLSYRGIVVNDDNIELCNLVNEVLKENQSPETVFQLYKKCSSLSDGKDVFRRNSGLEYAGQDWDSITKTKDTLVDDLRFFTVQGALETINEAPQKTLSVARQVCHKVMRIPRYKVFTHKRFFTIGSRKAVYSALRRLVKEGVLMRAWPGVYVRPIKSSFSNETVPVLHDEIVLALARDRGETIQLQGAEMARSFKLSRDVPMRQLYWTDGRSRVYDFGGWGINIELRHVNVRMLQMPDTVPGAALRALWFIGKRAISNDVIRTLRYELSEEGFATLKSLDMPKWMAKPFQEYEQMIKSVRRLPMPDTAPGAALRALWFIGKRAISTDSIETLHYELSEEDFVTLKSLDMPKWMAKPFQEYEQMMKTENQRNKKK